MASSAMSEASSLYALYKRGESIQNIRRLIGTGTRERKQILHAFDMLSDPEACILGFLRQGWSQKKIRDTLKVGPGIILRLSKRIHASYLKTGRGRRLSPELQARIAEAVKTGRTSASIQRELHVDWETVRKFRFAIGDHENRRFRTKLKAEALGLARVQLEGGARWRDVAAAFGVSPETLLRHLSYRKHKTFMPAELAEATESLKRGVPWTKVAADLGICRQTLQKKIAYRKHTNASLNGEQQFVARDWRIDEL